MNQKFTLQQMIPFLFVLLIVAAVGVVIGQNINTPTIPVPSAIGESPAGKVQEDAFDYAQAAEVSAMRWQAMARFYEENDLLARDTFDYEAAADNMAYRWQAMAHWYEKAGLLNEHMDPGDVMAFRWQAMARAYERMGLLNDQ